MYAITRRESGSTAEYHHPSSAASMRVTPPGRASVARDLKNQKMPIRQSNETRVAPCARAMHDVRPVASTRNRVRRRRRTLPAISIIQTPSAACSTDSTRAPRYTVEPCSSAQSASMRSNLARSTCHPDPYGLKMKSLSRSRRRPQAERTPKAGACSTARNRSQTPRPASSGRTAGGSVSPTRMDSYRDRSITTVE